MVLAQPEHVEAQLVGQLDLFQQVADALLGRDEAAGARVGRALGEGVEAKFEGRMDRG